jgi:hypothetical protein
MLQYLKLMAIPGQWGSTPEYTAFAFMAKLNVQVFQPRAGSRELLKVNVVDVPDSKGTIKLLYTGSNHYDLLLSDDECTTLRRAWPRSKTSASVFTFTEAVQETNVV